MSIDKGKLSEQYNKEKGFFDRVAIEIQDTLSRIASVYFDQTRLKVFIPAVRIKQIESILSKLERKGRSAESLYSNANDGTMSLVLNDFIGGRILCNTNEDVVQIVAIIEKHKRFAVVKRDDLKKESGYRAIHLDLTYSTYHKDSPVKVPLELQVKTFFQHAWAEVTHDDTYKPTDNMGAELPSEDYYKNIAAILDGLDGFLSTIRSQKLSYITPPEELEDTDKIINSKTLSFKVNQWKSNTKFTNQEMNLVLSRLRELNYQTLEDINKLLEDESIRDKIRVSKSELKNLSNVSAFEMLLYGPLFQKGKPELAISEIQSNLGFVKHKCSKCSSFLTENEYDFIIRETDSDYDFYCEKHRLEHFLKRCEICNKYTTAIKCLKCEAEDGIPLF
ncbi:hypothetical protein FUA23_18300 [Neolewinella aurantiaca]|uniref:RelA/SpoT domain-containing protein n=1 Tax=Neolewinella aurantiaca TaxID=2602767 RepID=A0A5C7FA86_9BACT|nr:hypothetical protein [Neolewinella aurantiaca]TXF87542.1 hypothetical protein FUA23_18300 [Neolewinella aurantiaca]